MQFNFLVYCFVSIIWFYLNSCCEIDPVVYTNKGAVKGVVNKTIWNTTYYIFWGIPYAKPPLGQLRFMPPEEMDYWDDIKHATNQMSSCTNNEDCLYLNIFTPFLPNVINSSKNKLLPVMIWIHGGSFTVGTGHYHHELPDFFMDENVIWVSFNYRLGIFGFLNSKQLNVSGNAGMKDQVEVFKWVRRNIHKFGGDRDRVTLIGWSAGSASVHYHLMSPLSEGLFHGAILQSGSAICPWAFTNDGDEISNLLCNELYNVNCSSAHLPMLQQENLLDLSRFYCHKSKIFLGIYPTCFVPNVDGTFLTDTPLNILKQDSIKRVPMIIGFTSLEGNILDDKTEDFVEKVFTLCTSNSMNFTRTNFSDVVNMIKKHALGDGDLENNNMMMILATFITECMTFHGISKTVDVLSKKIHSSEYPIYFYQFSFNGTFNFNKLGSGVIEFPGASHGDDNGYLFRNGYVEDSLYITNSRELLTLKRMVKMWTNFAKIKNPTPEITDLLPIKWLPVTSQTQYMLNIDDELTMMQDFNKSVVDFYSQFYDY